MNIDQIRLDRYNIIDVKYGLDEIPEMIKPALEDLDAYLADAFCEVIAVLAYFKNFDYLLVAPDKMVANEIRILHEENELEPLKKEIDLLKKDCELLKRLPGVLRYGLFEFDISGLQK